jgi:hypothetical protein
MGAGVPSCETCTPSWAGRGGDPSFSCEEEEEEEEEEEGCELKLVKSASRYRADEFRDEEAVAVAPDADDDACWCWDWARDSLKVAALVTLSTPALRSTPSTI